MLEHELSSENCREVVCLALQEAGIDNIPIVNVVCLRSLLHWHYGGTVWTEKDDNGLVEIVASAPYSNFVMPKTELEMDKAIVTQKLANTLETRLGHLIHRDFPDAKNKRAITRIKLTPDLAKAI